MPLIKKSTSQFCLRLPRRLATEEAAGHETPDVYQLLGPLSLR